MTNLQPFGQFVSAGRHFCRKFKPTDGRLAYLQQIVPPSLVTEVSTSHHNSVTAGHLDACENIEKIRQRLYWPWSKPT